MNKIGVWSNSQRKVGENIRMYWTRWQKLQSHLIKSNISFPDQVNFRKSLTGIKLVQPSLGILLGAIESRNIGVSINELKRSAVKLFDAKFMESSEDILNVNAESGDAERLLQKPRKIQMTPSR